jgi:copper chaperone CopZ
MIQSHMVRRKRLLGVVACAVLLAIATAAAADNQASRSAARARVTYSVKGMRCYGCAAKVHDGLSKMDGVLSAVVTYEPSRATVEFRPSKTDPAALRAVIVRLGFEAEQEGRVEYLAGEKPPK